MTNLTTQCFSKKEIWMHQMADVITNPYELLQLLSIRENTNINYSKNDHKHFAMRVPRTFIERMSIGNKQDPLLLQVLTSKEEFDNTFQYSEDPLYEHANIIPGLLRKYKNRALLLVKNCCAINCRYCFRQHFPYQNNPGNKRIWQIGIDYIALHPELDEIILSGGDPLIAKDDELKWLIESLDKISHLKRLRIHSRMPVIIPARITSNLCKIFSKTRLQILVVNHINHMQEIDQHVCDAMHMLKIVGVTLLNQSVLLRKINDTAQCLANLSNALFDAGILPYYLHILDKVKGAEHFFVSDDEARKLLREMMTMVSGYMVPKLVREIAGEPSKILLDLNFRQE